MEEWQKEFEKAKQDFIKAIQKAEKESGMILCIKYLKVVRQRLANAERINGS
jgi:hypothetical protein